MPHFSHESFALSTQTLTPSDLPDSISDHTPLHTPILLSVCQQKYNLPLYILYVIAKQYPHSDVFDYIMYSLN